MDRSMQRAPREPHMSEVAGDLFPSSPRVFYAKAPLYRVQCQVRFPTILRIESSAPAEFQERIRDTFPLFERAHSPVLPPLPPEIMQGLGHQLNPTVYNFMTEDRAATVTLTVDALTLSTTNYNRWEIFLAQFRALLSALKEVYRPIYFGRIGLRYSDFIDRADIGLDNVPWSRLFRSEILGEVAIPAFENVLEDARRILRLRLPSGNGSVLINHGLGFRQGHSQPGYLFDFDFFNETRTEVYDAEPALSRFHEQAGRAFRWCITELLHDALEPSPLQ